MPSPVSSNDGSYRPASEGCDSNVMSCAEPPNERLSIARPSTQHRFGLLRGSLMACASSATGIALGWALARSRPTAVPWMLPAITWASALILVLEVLRTNGRSKLWIASLCAFIASRSAYELMRLLLHR